MEIPDALMHKARRIVRHVHKRLARGWRMPHAASMTVSDLQDLRHDDALLVTCMLTSTVNSLQLMAALRCFGAEAEALLDNLDEATEHAALISRALGCALDELRDCPLERCSCIDCERPMVVLNQTDVNPLGHPAPLAL